MTSLAHLRTAACLLPARFLFVDCIAAFDAGRLIGGSLTVPADLAELSPCLVAEAIGQLAAWAAMAEAGFTRRPVAALAAAVEVRATVRAGERVELTAAIDSCAADAIAYSGEARVNGRVVVAIRDCVGAMLPMADFDDPRAMQERFAALCGVQREAERAAGHTVGHSVAFQPRMVVDEHCPGVRLRARLRVPDAAPFFADHFPRKPVFPATLLLDAQLRLATALREGASPGCALPLPASVLDVKLRSFVGPEEELELCADVVRADTVREVALTATAGGKRICRARWQSTAMEEP